jgi:hypothetical protein
VPVVFHRVEDDPLALAEGAEDGALEGPGAKVDLGPVDVTYDDAHPRHRVVGLDDTLVHEAEVRP